MSRPNGEAHTLLIKSLQETITEKLPAKTSKLVNVFIKQFFVNVAYEDLVIRDPDDLYGCAISFWKFLNKHKPHQTDINIYNPDFERSGWTSTHTIIQIIHDDMPFLIDSLRMEIDRMGFTTHLMIQLGGFTCKRNKKYEVTEIFKRRSEQEGASHEALMYFEIDRQTDETVLKTLKQNLERVLTDVRLAVEDWASMNAACLDAAEQLARVTCIEDKQEHAESVEFLKWIASDHFTFMGVRDYDLVEEDGEHLLRVRKGSGLGVLREAADNRISRNLSGMTPEARRLFLSPQEMMIIAKTNTRASIHRPVYTDCIDIKLYNDVNEVIGERRIIGTFTSMAYHANPKHIPLLRGKVKAVMTKSDLGPRSHAGRVLLNILETLPRDDLLQSNEDELLTIAMGIYHMQDRPRIRLFMRKDIYGRFISCLVFVPRERFNSALRLAMEKELTEFFAADECTFSTMFSESNLARIHFLLRVDPHNEVHYDEKIIEKRLIEIGRSWGDDLNELLIENFGEEQGNQYVSLFTNAFPSNYIEHFPPRMGIYDIRHISRLNDNHVLELNCYQPIDQVDGLIRFKIYERTHSIPLSDVIPILEKLGMRVINERPYPLSLTDGNVVWINDFGMRYAGTRSLDIDKLRRNFENAFLNIWFGLCENDAFNRLILGAEMTWREVTVVRAYAKYLRQIGFTFSQDYIESALNEHPKICQQLIKLFKCRFDPKSNKQRKKEIESISQSILQDLDNVANLDEDRILRAYLAMMMATLRTNFYQTDEKGEPKSYLSFKIDPRKIPDMPLPRPMYEIFVYSPRFEGIHLRSGKVARGGLRWSDRREDFRTEVLGLMKAQRVKNAVIVPAGAKGGFVSKCLPENGDRDAIFEEGIACYKNFIRGLLDITDNYNSEGCIKPKQVICYDDDDPYLVVAADKGTATFSDIANEISKQYNFWLGDAFASGGSAGYDHKKMGITARGGWESVKRHFRELGHNTQTQPFTVVGIGDMAGDVFGNGMLLSRQIKLVAAYNHMHIFIDPYPDPESSFIERERLFHLPRSSWKDYNPKIISTGGGVFDRKAKSIPISAQMKKVFDINDDQLVPNELIKAILRSEVDLIWNGGIGTYVKADYETDAEVGDRGNDSIRIDATELRARVVGEGGNLGFTQLGRVQYSMLGGKINTDFIDNSAGVDCSDHEVNIKILLNDVVHNGDLTEKQRNILLAEMTDEVAELVLDNNYQQTQAISVAEHLAKKHVDLHLRYMQELESQGKLERSVEYLPDEKTLRDRKLAGRGLTRPGLALLFAYGKNLLKEDILNSNVPEDPFLSNILVEAFPRPIRERFREQMDNHHLKREIIATQLANKLVNEVGFSFIYRVQEETGANVEEIVRAYSAAHQIFNIDQLWGDIQLLDNKIPSKKQIQLLLHVMRLQRRTTRWLLRYNRHDLDIAKMVDIYQSGVQQIRESLSQWLGPQELKKFEKHVKGHLDDGVPPVLAQQIASINGLFAGLDIVDTALTANATIAEVAQLYFYIGERLQISWIRRCIIEYPVDNHWEAFSREALRDELDWQQRDMTQGVMQLVDDHMTTDEKIKLWSQTHDKLVKRWERILDELRSSTTLTITMFLVATRELLDLTRTTLQSAKASIEPQS